LVFAVLYLFGLECGVGTDKLSRFFNLIRIDTHVGVSPSALRLQLKQMEVLLPQFQAECENRVKGQSRKAVVAMDETFFGEFLILVLMDLRSGYLLLEEISEDRRFDTGYAKTAPRLESLGIEVNHAMSDRAKALIKLAISGFECDAGADVFHAQQEVSRWLGARLARRRATAEKQIEATQRAEAHGVEMAANPEKTRLVKPRLEAEEALDQAQQTRADYHEHLPGIAAEIHPFSLSDNRPKSAKQVEAGLENRAKAFERITNDQGIEDKNNTLKTFRNQIQALAVTVRFWWRWVRETLQGLAVNTAMEPWLTTTLLPLVYWHHQLHKTQNRKARDRYRNAWQQAVQTFNAHPVTRTLSESEIQRWLTWAESMVRPSTAVHPRWKDAMAVLRKCTLMAAD
jgi:hypothetical protein